ncbi:MAG TPA: GNAT family N-acetyltransferase [Caulobacteraceae bacterium]|nr:GNAT family N-acetyltransferase [Caulobacteraceae bacterium]
MIETARLILSAWTEAERAPFVAMCADPEVMHDYPAPEDAVTASARFDRYAAALARDGFGKWALRRRDDGAFLGFCGVSPIWGTLLPAPGLEIGWRMVRAAWGRGYATEAARASLADIFARTDADEVISFTLPTNTRSLAVMARLGLTRDASRDFVYETGLPAVVFVASRIRYAVRTEGTT